MPRTPIFDPGDPPDPTPDSNEIIVWLLGEEYGKPSYSTSNISDMFPIMKDLDYGDTHKVGWEFVQMGTAILNSLNHKEADNMKTKKHDYGIGLTDEKGKWLAEIYEHLVKQGFVASEATQMAIDYIDGHEHLSLPENLRRANRVPEYALEEKDVK